MKMAFDMDLYSEEAVIRSIRAFQDIAEIKAAKQGGAVICECMSSKYDLEQTMLEFGNYVLNLSAMKEREKTG